MPDTPLNPDPPDLVYHVSEEGDIPKFLPRPSREGEKVWTIGERLLHNYLLPRDCPRVTYYAGPDTTAADIDCFLGPGPAAHVVAVEKGWLDRIQSCTLYLYELPGESFSLLDPCAAYYLSCVAVEPLRVTRIDDPLKALPARDVELRFRPSLWRLHHAVVRSALQFSSIRMRNACVPHDEQWIADLYWQK